MNMNMKIILLFLFLSVKGLMQVGVHHLSADLTASKLEPGQGMHHYFLCKLHNWVNAASQTPIWNSKILKMYLLKKNCKSRFWSIFFDSFAPSLLCELLNRVVSVIVLDFRFNAVLQLVCQNRSSYTNSSRQFWSVGCGVNFLHLLCIIFTVCMRGFAHKNKSLTFYVSQPLWYCKNDLRL